MNVDHARIIAACTALSGFVVSIIASAGAGNTLDEILARAIVALTVCFAAGWAIGAAARLAFTARVEEMQRTERKETDTEREPIIAS